MFKTVDVELSSRKITDLLKRLDLKEALDGRYGEGGWSIDELVQMAEEGPPDDGEVKDTRPEEKQEEEACPEPVEEGLKFEEVMARYREYYDLTAPNDEPLLTSLVLYEIMIDRLQREIQKQANPRVMQGIAKTLQDLQKEHISLQTTLGIDRKTRSKTPDSGIDEVIKVRDRAKQILDERSVPIVCPHCLKDEAGTEINQGFILFHFDGDTQWEWKSVCPKCGGVIVLSGAKTTSTGPGA